MKHTLTVVLLCICAWLQAQDSLLPRGKCEVYLTSGKTLREVRLWRLHANTLEYMKDGSLHDLAYTQIEHLLINNELWRCDSARLFRVQHDWILPFNDDTIYCMIRRVKPRTLVYQLPGSKVYQSIELCYVVKYNRQNSAGVTGVRPKESRDTVSTPGALPQSGDVRDTTKQEKRQSSHTRHPDKTTNFFARGYSDGMKEFQGNGSFTGGLILGMIPIGGWFVSLATMAFTPKIIPHNGQIYADNLQYRKGYRKGLRHKKAMKTAAGTVTGIATLIGLIALI